jgi:hypothetical protein
MTRISKFTTALQALGWSALAVVGPFFACMVLVQVAVRCEHCRAVWRSNWPILPGAVPAVYLGFRYGGWQFYVILGVISLALITGVFLMSYRSRYRRRIWAATTAVFSLLAVLTHFWIAA